MTDIAVEFRSVSKVFSSKKSSDIAVVKDINLKIFQGEFFTVLGPSGCGKTTILRMIAGFEKPSSGEIYLQGKKINRLPAYRRPINTVFQNYALFPHMTVARNVGYGLRVQRTPRAERRQRVAEALAMVRMDGMEDRRPSELSGGQQQRVALARALINRPTVLALDEPLGALDLRLRKQMQYELTRLQTRLSITFIYVTHDQEEALAMSDRIAVINSGRILQVDSPAAIYQRPSTRFVASFIGENNFLRGKITYCGKSSISVYVAGELIQVDQRGQEYEVDQKVFLAIRPERMKLGRQEEVDAMIREQCHILTQSGIIDDPSSLPHRRRRDRYGRISAMDGRVESRMFIGTSTRYIVHLKNRQTVVVRVQNNHEHESNNYTHSEQVKIWFYMEDVRLILK